MRDQVQDLLDFGLERQGLLVHAIDSWGVSGVPENGGA
jgi:hypothetical protein